MVAYEWALARLRLCTLEEKQDLVTKAMTIH